MKTTSDIRSAFLSYFARNGHTVVASAPLVPHNDPTLMFTNAGMVPFKNVFTGQESRPYTRAASSQKCVRAGGKHNDLDNVGYTARHHTFFEMLGNFSFGDYFKEQAITHAWTLTTKDLGLPKDRLLVTVHSSDEEAATLWSGISGLPESRIVRIPTSDNFWSMGDTGPCGPCSEIFYDHGDHIWGGPPGSAEQDGDRFIEIWNLVFMQFEQVDKETRLPLPKPSIDTGMGLERISAVLQGVHDNYDTDLMRALIEATAHAANTDPDGPHKVSHRVVADHLRSACFLIADGVLPSNEGRGYVLRRIMRRAMRHIHIMGVQEPMMWTLVPAMIEQMGKPYPELDHAHTLIIETLKLEETRFKQMLDRGLRLLEDEKAKLPSGGALPGSVAFTLYDTYGFPLDLTQDALRSEGYSVDQTGYEAAMEAARAKARASWTGSGDATTEKIWFELKERLGATEFLGYATEAAEGQVSALIVDGISVLQSQQGQNVALITNQTPFYGESGGQIGDRGLITANDGKLRLVISDTQKKLGGLTVHIGEVVSGHIAVGDSVFLTVESRTRSATRSNHSATHLLHTALRRRLGDHVTQKGAMVDPDHLRFDISHAKALTPDEIRDVETAVNAEIQANHVVSTRIMDPDSAIKAGAMALFGEKYSDEVRVVSMGDYSTELCGGTHVQRTGDIGFFKILSESAVGSGIRRIEGVTGSGALRWVNDREALLSQSADILKVAVHDLPSRITALQDEKRRLERELEEARKKLALGAGASSSGEAGVKTVNGIAFASRILENVPAKDLKSIADEIKKQIGSGVTAIISVTEGKASLVIAVTEDLTPRLNAVDLVRAGSTALGGKGGGGRADMAQAGGPEGTKAADALAAIEAALRSEIVRHEREAPSASF